MFGLPVLVPALRVPSSTNTMIEIVLKLIINIFTAGTPKSTKLWNSMLDFGCKDYTAPPLAIDTVRT